MTQKTIIRENTSVDLAISDVLTELDLELHEVEILVLQNAKKGFMGIGKKLARIQVTIKESNQNSAGNSQPPTTNSAAAAVSSLTANQSSETANDFTIPEAYAHNPVVKDLNNSQAEAVLTTEGYIRVVAGAGSGKTRALTNRYAHLVQNMGIIPNNILCITFTNKAAHEMKKRIRKMVGNLDLGKIATFHGFCVQLLREDYHVVQYPSRFLILDEEDTLSLLKETYKALGVSTKAYPYKKAKIDIAFLKDTTNYVEWLADPSAQELNTLRENASEINEVVFYEFLHQQRKLFGLDFDDLINFAFYILKTDKTTREKWQTRLQYIMVDEFQDVNAKQYALAKILSKHHENLFIVGDPDQTIYTWRGADVEYILHFDSAFEDVKTIMMNQNYRSLPAILTTSNALIDKNENRMKKELIPYRTGSTSCTYYHAKTEQDEALWISQQIKTLTQGDVSHSDIAILFRASHASRPIEEQFVRSGISYTLYSGVGFYLRKEIKDILCYFRMVLHADDTAFLRIINEPKRGMGEKRLTQIKSYATKNNCSLYQSLKNNRGNSGFSTAKADAFIDLIEALKESLKTQSISDFLNEVLEKTEYEELLRKSGDDERLDNIAELKQSIYDYETTIDEEATLQDYLDHIALFTNIDKNEKTDSVKMMTIHASKGLEFPYVFVCSLHEGTFPSCRIATSEQMEEERRLAYVAMTRAENGLFLSDSEGKNYDGTFRYPSRFIFECEKENLDYVVELPPRLVSDTQRQIELNNTQYKTNSPFTKDSRVTHEIFGSGTIIDVIPKENCYVIKFDNVKTARRLSFSARLQSAEESL